MCFDSEGNIVDSTAGINTSGPGPMIYVFEARRSGRVLETHRVPTASTPPRTAHSEGRDQSTLYITSGQGHLLKVGNTGRKGWIRLAAG